MYIYKLVPRPPPTFKTGSTPLVMSWTLLQRTVWDVMVKNHKCHPINYAIFKEDILTILHNYLPCLQSFINRVVGWRCYKYKTKQKRNAGDVDPVSTGPRFGKTHTSHGDIRHERAEFPQNAYLAGWHTSRTGRVSSKRIPRRVTYVTHGPSFLKTHTSHGDIRHERAEFPQNAYLAGWHTSRTGRVSSKRIPRMVTYVTNGPSFLKTHTSHGDIRHERAEFPQNAYLAWWHTSRTGRVSSKRIPRRVTYVTHGPSFLKTHTSHGDIRHERAEFPQNAYLAWWHTSRTGRVSSKRIPRRVTYVTNGPSFLKTHTSQGDIRHARAEFPQNAYLAGWHTSWTGRVSSKRIPRMVTYVTNGPSFLKTHTAHGDIRHERAEFPQNAYLAGWHTSRTGRVSSKRIPRMVTYVTNGPSFLKTHTSQGDIRHERAEFPQNAYLAWWHTSRTGRVSSKRIPRMDFLNLRRPLITIILEHLMYY